MTNINSHLLFKQYMNKYKKLYPTDAYEFIVEHYNQEGYKNDAIPDIVNQIYSYTGLIEDHNNIYKAFLSYLKEYYGVNKNILEVGCGFFPELTRLIDLEQDEKSNITGIDPILIFDNYENLNIKQERFTDETNVSQYDLLISMMPCDAGIPMIRRANQQNKELMIEMCGCTHWPSYQLRAYDYGLWMAYVEDIIKNTIPDQMDYKIEEHDDLPYPLVRTFNK